MKTKKIIISLMIFIIIITMSSISTAMTHYYTVDTPTGLVTASVLNVRQGPGTNYEVVTVVYKNEYIRVFARDWRLVRNSNR